MQNSEFDGIVKNYNEQIVESLGFFGRIKDTAHSYKSDYLKYLLPETPNAILEFGCGIGMNLPYLRKKFPKAELFGCDVSQESISLASESVQGVTFDTIKNLDGLKIYENKIDCVFISMVLHHISPEEREKWIKGLYDVLKKGGHMVVFENNMKNPLTKKFVERLPMDNNAVWLDAKYCKNIIKKVFGEKSDIKLGYAYIFPWRDKIFTWMEHRLRRLPLGAQYYVIARK